MVIVANESSIPYTVSHSPIPISELKNDHEVPFKEPDYLLDVLSIGLNACPQSRRPGEKHFTQGSFFDAV